MNNGCLIAYQLRYSICSFNAKTKISAINAYLSLLHCTLYLSNLLQKAVEYYEERGNPKYAIYQKRMHHFLKQPQIKMILKGVPGELAVKKEES